MSERQKPQDPVGITFKAHFARAATQADGALRISLDVSPSEAQALVTLLQMKDRVFQVALVPEPRRGFGERVSDE